jgi:hypothetical protein
MLDPRRGLAQAPDMATRYSTAVQPKRAVPIVTAAQNQPTLARLIDQQRQSEALWKSVRAALPEPLRLTITPSSIENGAWCLLAPNNALAAKLKQLQPVLLAHAQAKGFALDRIRIKVSGALAK